MVVSKNLFPAKYQVGIVFSPTLNIPAPVFSLFITEYEVVFDEPDDIPETSTPPAAPEPALYNLHSETPPPVTHPNHHLNVHEQHSHRRYHSADPPHRASAVPPASFPVYNRGYQEPPQARQQAAQQQSYPQQSYQPSFQQQQQQQQYRNYLSPQPTYQQGRWANSREEADLFG